MGRPDNAINAEPASDGQEDDDVHDFSIDEATGQISVKKSLDYDNNMDGYTFHVRAIDPSGETAHVEVTVKQPTPTTPRISGTAEYDRLRTMYSKIAPTRLPSSAFGRRLVIPTTARLECLYAVLPGSMNVFTADDDDARGQIFWSIKGEDVDDFELTSSSPDPFTGLRGPGEPIGLKFVNDPDFENPTDSNYDSVYKVTIVARDRFTGGLEDERSLTIFVDNVAEEGDASLSEDQPHHWTGCNSYGGGS